MNTPDDNRITVARSLRATGSTVAEISALLAIPPHVAARITRDEWARNGVDIVRVARLARSVNGLDVVARRAGHSNASCKRALHAVGMLRPLKRLWRFRRSAEQRAKLRQHNWLS